MKTKLILAFAMSLLSATASAGAWTQIETNADEVVLIDADSIKANGDEIEVRALRSYPSIQLNLLDGEWRAFRSQVATYSVQCQEGKLGYVDWTLHHGAQGKGRAVHQGKIVGVMAGDAPANAGDRALLANVCGSEVARTMLQSDMLAKVEQ